jgi:hypothetical protein
MSEGRIGKTHAPEVIAKMSNTKQGWKPSAGMIEKVRESNRRRAGEKRPPFKYTPELLEKRRAQRPTAETREKMSKAQTGRKHSP